MTTLKNKLQTHLPNARSARTGYHAKRAAAVIAARIIELRVIEGIEKLGAEFKGGRFRKVSRLHQRHIPIGKTRAGKEAAAGGAERTEAFRCERAGQEISIGAIGAWVMGVLRNDRTNEVGRIGVGAAG